MYSVAYKVVVCMQTDWGHRWIQFSEKHPTGEQIKLILNIQARATN